MWVIQCRGAPILEHPFASKLVHRSQTLLEPPLQHFYLNFPLIHEKLSWKTSPLVRLEILRLFGNTLTADHMYSHHRSEKLPEQVERLISQKGTKFSGLFIAFWNLHKILLILKKKITFIA